MIRIVCKHLLDVCLADESHPAADSWCRKFTLVYQLVNVLTGASHKDGSLGECEILLVGDVYNWLDCLQKVLLLLLALSLCFLSTMLSTIPLRAAVTSELLSTEGAFSCLSHLTPFYVVLQSISCKPPRSELSSIIDTHCQLIPRCHVLQMRSLPCSFPSRSSVNCCTLLSTFVNPVYEMAKIKALKILRGRNALQR